MHFLATFSKIFRDDTAEPPPLLFPLRRRPPRPADVLLAPILLGDTEISYVHIGPPINARLLIKHYRALCLWPTKKCWPTKL